MAPGWRGGLLGGGDAPAKALERRPGERIEIAVQELGIGDDRAHNYRFNLVRLEAVP